MDILRLYSLIKWESAAKHKTKHDTSWIIAAATAYVTPVQTSSACKLLVSACEKNV